ncbi:sensor histidine kinase [Paracoccaceae bacterium GXU_MW_L88]
MFNTLSRRFLLLSMLFVLLAEVLIFVPSVSNMRVEYLQGRLERAQIASLALLAADTEMIDPVLESELLSTAGVLNIVLRRNSRRELVLTNNQTHVIDESFDLRMSRPIEEMVDSMRVLFIQQDRVIRVIGRPVNAGGTEIEVTLVEGPLRQAMIAYSLSVLWVSLIISLITAALLFFAVRYLMVGPIKRLVSHMQRFQTAPDKPDSLIAPASNLYEIREAEQALQTMEGQVQGALRQKERLAALGGAVARISHDLRNMLATTQLFADHLESSNDPAVARIAPKMTRALSRAVTLCTHTLTYGRAQESPAECENIRLDTLTDEVLEEVALEIDERRVTMHSDINEGCMIHADRDKMFRVLSNLTRNAAQAIEGSGKTGEVRVAAEAVEVEGRMESRITVSDTGPGLPQELQNAVFEAFGKSGRKGGTGLGLAIAAELVSMHGGQMRIASSGPEGTVFEIRLPKNPDCC